MKKKYNINKDFKKLNKTNPPINKVFARISQFFLRLIFNFQKSTKDCKVEKRSVILNNIKMRYIIITPSNIDKKAPCLIYYHGGGFMLPAGPYHYRNAKKYALDCGCKVFIPDFPLTPKYQFPIQPQICFEFYKMIFENLNKFNINNKIIVGGDSAGANLASIVGMMASDNNMQIPIAQMLIYPVVGVNFQTESMKMFDDTGMCNSKDFEKYCKLYFKNFDDRQNRYVSPLNQEYLEKYPTTYIETAEFDCLHDDGVIFANKLKENGVIVK